ncbi:glycoside hydrolase family 66 protein [Paenibacillus sp. V4I7]|uniref:glycoside hydrolase family 66 protein n=1 Tax=Paenibacillus sp. V4I7 TaxID=3042307 RepID=UPI00278543BD|nr:glycoside hydrolase family 66 protein [Paenibacillus sp. V4I7]MDQ0900527.1 dextranase [Paenibacillus sp. V4I7]
MFPQMKDVFASKAQFVTNEPVSIEIELDNPAQHEAHIHLEVKILDSNRIIKTCSLDLILQPNSSSTHVVELASFDSDFQGYGIDVDLIQDGAEPQHFSSAFDVVSNWRKSPRYGFLSDFHSREEGDTTDVTNLNKLHINLVQFYDWMYRHNDLVPPQDVFTDLMGRELSLKVVKEKIALCHSYGMKAIAYGAIYAASKAFFEEHPDWALYYSNGHVVDFINIFSIMNINEESPWHNHIINEYKKTIENVHFDGIHMDTYGYPKTGISMLGGKQKVERLDEQFPILIRNTRQALDQINDDVCLIFNNVGNWPVDTVALAEQDVIYIEVWNPYEKYHHIQQVIAWAKHLGRGKPVILAAYLKPFRLEPAETIEKAHMSALLLSAIIFSQGAYHLLLGESNGVLTQGYYADYSIVSDEFMRNIRNYYDFLVRYVHLLQDSTLRDVSMTHVQGDNLEYMFENASFSTYGEPNKVWTVVRENESHKLISFINLTNNLEDYWNEGKLQPTTVEGIMVRIQIDGPVKHVFTASPDIEMGRPHDLMYTIEDTERGLTLLVNLPKLYVWSLLVIEV